MSNLFDGLPLNTPTLIAAFSRPGDIDVWATRTRDPLIGGSGTVEYRAVPGGPTDIATTAAVTADGNATTMRTGLANALARLRTIKTQTTTFASQAPYGTANLTNLNDLLAKSQQIATAVGDLADDIRYIARILSNQLDATT